MVLLARPAADPGIGAILVLKTFVVVEYIISGKNCSFFRDFCLKSQYAAFEAHKIIRTLAFLVPQRVTTALFMIYVLNCPVFLEGFA